MWGNAHLTMVISRKLVRSELWFSFRDPRICTNEETRWAQSQTSLMGDEPIPITWWEPFLTGTPILTMVKTCKHRGIKPKKSPYFPKNIHNIHLFRSFGREFTAAGVVNLWDFFPTKSQWLHIVTSVPWTNPTYLSGWWFGTFLIFHIRIGNNNPNWLIFFRGVESTNQSYLYLAHLTPLFSVGRTQWLGWITKQKIRLGGFQSIGVPPVSIHFRLGFSIIPSGNLT